MNKKCAWEIKGPGPATQGYFIGTAERPWKWVGVVGESYVNLVTAAPELLGRLSVPSYVVAVTRKG